MRKIDIIAAIANTKAGRSEINLPDERIAVSDEGGIISFVYSGGYKKIPESEFETVIMRNILHNIVPEDYKVEVTYDNGENMTRCSIHSRRMHHTIAYGYGNSHIEAIGKCLLSVNKAIEKGEIVYGELGKD